MRLISILLAIVILFTVMGCGKAEEADEKVGLIPEDEAKEVEIPSAVEWKEMLTGRWSFDDGGWIELKMDETYLIEYGEIGVFRLSEEKPYFITLESEEETRTYAVSFPAEGEMKWSREGKGPRLLTKTTKMGL